MSKAKTLSTQEYKLLFKRIELAKHSERNKVIMMLSYKLGLRAKELSLLKVGDIWRDGRLLDTLALDVHTKNEKKRELPLSNQDVKRMLTDWVEHLYKSSSLTNESSFLFTTNKNNTFTAGRMAETIKTVYTNAGIEFNGCSSHSGRRTFITNLANKGIDLNSIRVLAGHSSIATTQIYIESNPILLSNIMKQA